MRMPPNYGPEFTEQFLSCYSDLARVVECTVFQKFFGNTPECMANAYAAYEEGSLFFLVVDQDEHTVAGALRVIVPSAKGLKTLNDVAEAPLHITLEQVKQFHSIENPRRCWDVVLSSNRDRTARHR